MTPINSICILALGGQKFSALPVALSLTATSLSAITMMGSPSEYYSYGSSYAWVIVADIIACLFAAFIYLPIYYNLGVTSIYEYVDMRFGRTSRVIMTGESFELNHRYVFQLRNNSEIKLYFLPSQFFTMVSWYMLLHWP